MDAKAARYQTRLALHNRLNSVEKQFEEQVDRCIRERALAGEGYCTVECPWYSVETLHKVKRVFEARGYVVTIKYEVGGVHGMIDVNWLPIPQ